MLCLKNVSTFPLLERLYKRLVYLDMLKLHVFLQTQKQHLICQLDGVRLYFVNVVHEFLYTKWSEVWKEVWMRVKTCATATTPTWSFQFEVYLWPKFKHQFKIKCSEHWVIQNRVCELQMDQELCQSLWKSEEFRYHTLEVLQSNGNKLEFLLNYVVSANITVILCVLPYVEDSQLKNNSAPLKINLLSV